MRNLIAIVFAFLFLVPTAFAEDWVPAQKTQCDTVCTNKDSKLKAVALGQIAGNEKSFVCAADFNTGNTNDAGFRAGYTTMSGTLGCAICGGDKCTAGRIPDAFMCLCVPK
jgi:hypothetical protein